MKETTENLVARGARHDTRLLESPLILHISTFIEHFSHESFASLREQSDAGSLLTVGLPQFLSALWQKFHADS